MGRFDDKSRLKSKTISKVWLNRKDYKFLDFKFKVTDGCPSKYYYDYFNMSVYNCDVLILKLEVRDKKMNGDERFLFKVTYFNPQTDNDCYSINHIIAVCSEYTEPDSKHKDMGNTTIIKNQFTLRKKDNYYSHVKIWHRGNIEEDNYDKHLSYEFATNEYIGYIKKIFDIKRMQRRKIKGYFKDYLNKMIVLDKLK